jgi:hypothetical protein
VRRALFAALGGFDEAYAPAYCEDSDLAFRLRQAGYVVLYQPRSAVIHFEGVARHGYRHRREGVSAGQYAAVAGALGRRIGGALPERDACDAGAGPGVRREKPSWRGRRC